MSRSSTFDLHDRIFGGGLEALLAQWRAEGITYDDIAYRLRDKGIDVSRSTVNRWCRELGIESETEAAS